MALPKEFQHPYDFDPKYKKAVAYFSSEFAIHQPLKIYSGGLGFLAGSHMRSAYELKQNLIGVGILWKNGYYDQIRKGDQSMEALFQEKIYSFLIDTKIRFTININAHDNVVGAWYLPPQVFGTVPMFFLSTDLPENDYLAQSTTHRLYDSDPAARIAQNILLGLGGARLLDELKHETEIYHMNEAHSLSAAFHLYNKFDKNLEEVRKHLVFTTHTPEEAGNEKHDIRLLEKMGFFAGLSLDEVKEVSGLEGDEFNHSLVALRMSSQANGVSKKHGEVAREMWGKFDNICPIISITNAQSRKYWRDQQLSEALDHDNDAALKQRKQEMKKLLFEFVADQTGQIFDPNILTIVWARRFAAYKRPDLITTDADRWHALMTNKDFPLQIIWAGKPYPMDYGAISLFNNLVHMSKRFSNAAVMTGYELTLSKLLKSGSDVWLNNPRIPQEASGTSGMSAAMNGTVNLSTIDGWIPEFSRHGINSFVVPEVDQSLPHHEQDVFDRDNLLDVLENEILPTYYKDPEEWLEIVKNSMKDVLPYFDSDRMAYQYYEKLYSR